MAETNVFIFFRSLDHEIFMAERIGKNNLAALVYKVLRFIIAFRSFRNSRNEFELIFLKPLIFDGPIHRFDKVFVISGGFVVESNHTDFDVFFRHGFKLYVSFLTTGRKTCDGGHRQHGGKCNS